MKFTEAVKREAGEQQDMIGDDKAMTRQTGMWTLSDNVHKINSPAPLQSASVLHLTTIRFISSQKYKKFMI